ncbi:MAG: serine hydrolase [Bacteroidales bacterium]
MKKIFKIIILIIFLSLVYGIYTLMSIRIVATGYAAKNLASAVFVQGRNADSVRALDLNFSLIRFVKEKVDYKNKTITSKFLGQYSEAVYRDGCGVTLLQNLDSEQLRQQKLPTIDKEGSDSILAAPPKATTKGLDSIAIALIDKKEYNGSPFAFLAVHNDTVVAEHYRNGFDAKTRFLSWSMAKSFINAMVGCMTRDSLVDISAPTGLKEWQNDARREITINNLMHMTSGLKWNEDYGSRSDVNLMLHRESDMAKYAYEKPLKYMPGTHWYYSSGTTNIVSYLLRRKFASDSLYYDYMYNKVLGAIAIDDAVFELDESGNFVGSSYLYASARDFTKFGMLYLHDGIYNGTRILPEGWVEYTSTPVPDSKGRYGAFFWTNASGFFPDVPRDAISCIGHDGQYIIIVPSMNLVLVVVGYSPKPDHALEINNLVKDVISELNIKR